MLVMVMAASSLTLAGIGIGAGLATATWGLVYGALRWRTAETVETRAVLAAMREVFRSTIASGGATADVWLSGEGHGLETQLEDLMLRVRSRRLREELEVVIGAWRRTWSVAPAIRKASVYEVTDVISEADVVELEMKQRQVAAAREGDVAVAVAMASVNRLRRPLIPSS